MEGDIGRSRHDAATIRPVSARTAGPQVARRRRWPALLAAVVVAASVLGIPRAASASTAAGTDVSTVVGGTGTGPGTAIAQDPVSLAEAGNGSLDIGDGTTMVVRSLAPSGTESTVACAGNIATSGYGGDGGPATDASCNTPEGLVADGAAGTLLADNQNNRVRLVAATSGTRFGQAVTAGSIATVAGDGGPSNTGDGLPAVNASLARPDALAFDSTGNLYIAEQQANRVRRVDPSGIISTFAGSGLVGGFGSEGSLAVLTPLNAPQGVAADLAGNVYISDTNNDRVLRIDPSGDFHTVAGTGTPGSAGDGTPLGELYGPTGLALDHAGNLYIADTSNHRVRMLTPAGILATVAGTGVTGFAGDGGAAAAAQLSYPSALAVDAAGNLYIADTGNNRIRILTPDGIIATIAGTGVAAFNGETGLALQIALDNPGGLALDAQGDLFIADTGNNRVRELSVSQTVVTPPQLVAVTIASSASLLPGPLAPGEIFSIFSATGGLGPSAAASGAFGSAGTLATTLAGVQVLFNSIAAPLFYAQANQINAQVPCEMAGQTSAQMLILFQGAAVASMQVPLADANPALFTLGNGVGNAVAVNPDGSINSAQNPAPRGSIVVLYATGEGQTSPTGVTGQPAAAPYPLPVLPVSLTIGGIEADVLFAAEAPGFVGLLQINVQIPSGFVPTGDLPVVLSVGTNPSPPTVTIAVN